MRHQFNLPLAALVAVFSSLLLAPASAGAHEVPTDVVIQTIVHPADGQLDFLVRVPLAAMRDVNFPQTGPGYLVISEADTTLRDAATIWIAREASLYVGDTLLPPLRVAASSDGVGYQTYQGLVALGSGLLLLLSLAEDLEDELF